MNLKQMLFGNNLTKKKDLRNKHALFIGIWLNIFSKNLYRITFKPNICFSFHRINNLTILITYFADILNDNKEAKKKDLSWLN